jgi:hypothetical protein
MGFVNPGLRLLKIFNDKMLDGLYIFEKFDWKLTLNTVEGR